MNFFAEQSKAKRNTGLLIFLMIAAVLCLIAITIFLVSTSLYFTQYSATSVHMTNAINTPFRQHMVQLLNSPMVWWIGGGVLLMVIGGSAYKSLQLGGSGKKVALALGGRQLQPSSRDAAERKILNVVEEMAIASGNPVPPVFIMEESGINAFAAGTDRRNAVIGISRGCIDTLSRDELQGVVAHEFSHIHFGDMRLNLKLVAIIHGILLIGLTGSYLLRAGAYSSRRKNNGAQLGLGMGLMLMGYMGVFFGNIIKAAVSRQREYLADAAAVQFTRNPAGIANALKKIGGHVHGSYLASPNAAEFSHFYFGKGQPSFFDGFFSTHPPLQKRIFRIEPRWNGQYPKVEVTQKSNTNTKKTSAASEQIFQFTDTPGSTSAEGDVFQMDHIGEINPENIATAHGLLSALPAAIYDAAHDPFMARALIYCLLIDTENKNIAHQQIDILNARAHPVTYQAFLKLLDTVKKLPRHKNLPLLELAMPALKMQSKPQYQIFKQNLSALTKADKQVSLLEWCLYRSITHSFEEKTIPSNKKLNNLGGAVTRVVAALCYAGDVDDTECVYDAVEKNLPELKITRQNGAKITFKELDMALNQLSRLKPLDKPRFLKAMAAAISADNKVTSKEAELFRAIADTLNCPAPILDAIPPT